MITLTRCWDQFAAEKPGALNQTSGQHLAVLVVTEPGKIFVSTPNHTISTVTYLLLQTEGKEMQSLNLVLLKHKLALW